MTDALLDVALNVSSTFMLQMPLIEEGVQHVHPIDRNLRSFLRSCSHVVFLAQQPRINSLYVGGHHCLSSPSQQLWEPDERIRHGMHHVPLLCFQQYLQSFPKIQQRCCKTTRERHTADCDVPKNNFTVVTSLRKHKATNFTQTPKKKKNEFWNCHLAMLGRVAKPILQVHAPVSV